MYGGSSISGKSLSGGVRTEIGTSSTGLGSAAFRLVAHPFFAASERPKVRAFRVSHPFFAARLRLLGFGALATFLRGFEILCRGISFAGFTGLRCLRSFSAL